MPDKNFYFDIKNLKLKLLREYFGHDNFRHGQEALIDALLSGRDVIGIMPTGGGKSICYQIPALILPGVTLVISPLISLMKDQVMALNQHNISAAFINSSLSRDEYFEVLNNALQGKYKIIYAAPERILTPNFLDFAGRLNISLLAVDEAHCVSQWGQNFRPDYLKIAQFKNFLFKSYNLRPPIGAFTATATAAIRADIQKLLYLNNPLCITTGFDRPNLYFQVKKLLPREKTEHLVKFIKNKHKDQSGIVYCSTRKNVEKVCEKLCNKGIKATRYHAGLEDEERLKNQEDFISDRANIIVATNAFGMGIDKPDVRFVAHYNMPKDVESYYQEAGRAGRDGKDADCLLMFDMSDVMTAKYFIERDYEDSFENEMLSAEEREFIKKRDLWRFNQIEKYCKTTGCLRAYLLRYFGENPSDRCDNCGNCKNFDENFVTRDITLEAKKILSGVIRSEKNSQGRFGFGITSIINMLRGSNDEKLLRHGLDKIKTYGIMKDVKSSTIREYITCLIDKGYLYLTAGKYPCLHCIEDRTFNVFHDKEKVFFVSRRVNNNYKLEAQNEPEQIIIDAEKIKNGKYEGGEKYTKYKNDKLDELDNLNKLDKLDGLYETLKKLRQRLSKKAAVPAYIIFPNSALEDMAAKKPRNITEFLRVSGVGQIKAERYGEIFLNEISNWLKKNSS